MSGKHTRGPWKWQAEDECLVGPDQIVMRQDDEGRKSFADYPDGTTQANARLIAAAPDLLEALEMWLSAADIHSFDDAKAKARAAIAKARGEA